MKTKHYVNIAVSISLAAALGMSMPASAAGEQGKMYGQGYPFQLNQLPKGPLRDKLDKLPVKARTNAKAWLDSIRFHDRDLPFMRADNSGGIYFADTELPQLTTGTAGTPTLSTATVPVDVFKLHSKPGSNKIIYLDFNGHVVTGTAWNSSAASLTAVPYDLDGIPSSFSTTEQANVFEIWRRIAEDYSSFDVDVTTEQPVSFGPTVGRLLITKDTDANGLAMPAQGAGGVAYVGVWGRSDYPTTYSPAFVYYNRLGGGRADYVTEAASHEMGHNMGLSHDGTSTLGYYGGHGTGFISWGPIMGTGYGRHVSQWSKGEYADANQLQDDIALISSKISTRADDHGNTTAMATPLVVDTSGSVLSVTPQDNPYDQTKVNKGVLSTRDDIDVFSFVTTGGTVTLQATPARELNATSTTYPRGGNVDVQLALYDQAGNLVVSSDPLDETDAGISTSLGAGTYYLSVQGVGSANYSDYGSVGQFFIEGVLPVINDQTAPNPNPMGWTIAPEAKSRFSIHMTAVTATDDTSGVEYYFACTAGATGCVDSGWVKSPDYTANGLLANTAYSFQVKARDAFGNETASSATATATTLANAAPVAADDTGSAVSGASVTLGVLANDSDADGDTLRVTAVTAGSNGATVTFTNTGVTYQSAAGFVGTDTFTYTVDDGQGATATANVSVTVTAAPLVNRNPVAVGDTAKVVIGQTVVIPVLANDSDPDGNTLSISALGTAKRGRATHNGTQVTYVAGTRTGTDTFSYTVSDGKGGRATASITVSLVRR